ncbi:hypothetical protein TNCV_1827001 [Trichonephila clavipes]|nr:hypothetical protein TNCV_1827001 [Trichonephila clavipes]
MKCMHLGEKTGDQPTQRDKPSNLGEKTEDMATQRDKPSNLALDNEEASVSLGQVTKLALDAERQVFEGYRSGQVPLQAEPFIDVPVGPAVFGGRKEIRVVHREDL